MMPTVDEQTKTCPECLRTLPTSHFKINRAAKDGLYTYCRVCDQARTLRKRGQVTLEDGDVDDNLTSKPAGIPAHVLNGLEIPSTTTSPCQGVWEWKTPKGWHVMAIHYTADPKKRPGTPEGDAWMVAEKTKSSTRDWQREYEIDHTISEGEPFFTRMNRAAHVKPCKYNPELPLLRGWDFGRGHPACVWAQKAPNNQIRVLKSLLETQKDIFQFAPMVLAETNVWFGGAKIFDYGDPAGAHETDKGQTTAILLNEFKITLIHKFSFLETGLKMLERSLIVREDGEPGLLFDPSNTILIDGFAGGYKLDTGATGRDTEGRLKNTPKKDGWFDHLIDALRYIFVNIFSIAPTKDNQDKALESVSLWMTNEQHRQKQEAEEVGDWGDFFA